MKCILKPVESELFCEWGGKFTKWVRSEDEVEQVKMSQKLLHSAATWYLLALMQTHKYWNSDLEQRFAKIGQGEFVNIYELPNCSEEILTWRPS